MLHCELELSGKLCEDEAELFQIAEMEYGLIYWNEDSKGLIFEKDFNLELHLIG